MYILPYIFTHYNLPLKIIELIWVNCMKDIDFGEIKLHLDEIRKQQNISINKLACRAEMQRSQVRSYCNNTVQRLDMAVLARLCYALECDVTDIVEYTPPKTALDTTDT